MAQASNTIHVRPATLGTGIDTPATSVAVIGGGTALAPGYVNLNSTGGVINPSTEETSVLTKTSVDNAAASLTTVVSRTPTLGQKNATGSSPVVIASDQSTIPVVVDALPLPAGAATATLQSAGNASLTSLDGKLPPLVSGATPINVSGFTYSQSIMNVTTAQLAAGATWSGGIENAFNQPAVQIMCNSSQPYTITITQFQDSEGTKQLGVSSFTRSANVPTNETLQVNGNFLRISITNNGAITTTGLYVDTTYGPLSPLPTQLSNSGNFKVAVQESQGRETGTYLAAVAMIPTTLTTGLNYLWIRNTVANKKVRIEKIEVIMAFIGTAAASRSSYTIRKFTGATATIGTAITPVPGNILNDASVADIKWAPAGGTLTGAVVGGAVAAMGHANQLTANVVYDRDLKDAPIVLVLNEGIVLQSDGAVVAGTTAYVSIRWTEY